ncbi:MAG: RsbRD N-terminal domain-containing protein [Thermodesulfobacteriota bacterium]
MPTVESLIAGHKESITRQWIEVALKTYPAETASFFLREKDRFANPVAGSLSESLTKVIDGLASQASQNELSECLDAAIRVRAVQSFAPSEAVSFIFSLKQIIRDVTGGQGDNDNSGPYRQLDKKIDELVLLGFDKYMECREKIFELRAYEARNRVFKAFEKAGLVSDPEQTN